MPLPLPTALETLTLRAKPAPGGHDVVVYLAPSRGGMATRFFVDGHAVFYLDETTLLDPSKNVRGGNPVLFPSPGKLEGDRFTRDGKTGAMGQHGFARNCAWEVASAGEDTATLRLVANDATLAAYGWDFSATYTYSVTADAVLRIVQTIEATGDAPIPFGAGFHPYFAIPSDAKANERKNGRAENARIPTDATKAWDNARKAFVELDCPIDLSAGEVDLHLVDHHGDRATLDVGEGRRIVVRASSEFARWVIWTLPGKDFVCVEPWTCPANALNTGEGLLFATPGSPVTLWTEIALERIH